MLEFNDLQEFGNLVGYSALIQIYDLKVLPLNRLSLIAHKGGRKVFEQEGVVIHLYRKGYGPEKSTLGSQLEFALKHEGIELSVLTPLFEKIPTSEWEALIRATPTGSYTRKIWYLYEWYMGCKLKLEPAKGGSYVSLLDPEDFYTADPISSPRHRVYDNLLGNAQFCPVIRRSPILSEYEAIRLEEKGRAILARYPPNLLHRAAHYLFTKETLSSFQIEREEPSQGRSNRFIELLKRADGRLHLDIPALIKLQNAIVDPRFANQALRDFQNYIGEEVFPHQQTIHYIPPKPQQVLSLMNGLIDALDRMLASGVHPVVTAAAISFGFVFIHPFEDGNGRIHRFLIHHILSKTGFSPVGALFPVSAVMLRRIGEYDQVLELFSAPLLKLICDYTLGRDGALTIHQPTHLYYPYLDYTRMAEYLFECIQKVIEQDLEEELDYLERHDRLRSAISQIVELPSQKLELLIRCLGQNGGKLANRKRSSQFAMLTDQEIAQIEKMASLILSEEIIQKGFKSFPRV